MKHKTWIWTGCITLLAVIGIWVLSSTGGKSADVETIQNAPSSSPSTSVTIPDVTPAASPEPQLSSPSTIPAPEVPDIKQDAETIISETPILQPEKENKQVEVPITKPAPTPKPTEPPKPKPKATDKPQTSDSPPTYEEKETQPNKPKNEPKAGDKNSSGKVFVPGFGWVENLGENIGSQSTSDGDWNKQVGTMD